MRKSTTKESCPKSSNLWLPAWTTLLGSNSEDIIVRMKKMLAYYPKHPLAINLISSEIATELVKSHSSRTSLLRKLYSQVTSRYNSDLLTHHKLNTTCLGSRLWRKCKATRSLKLQQDESNQLYRPREKIEVNSSDALKKAIRGSKHLEILDLDGFALWADIVLKELKYVNSLKTLKIEDFHGTSLDAFKKSIFASRLSLEMVVLSGENMELSNPTEMWKIILELPKLKKLKIDCSSRIFDVNTIPFNILKKRNISFDIRVPRENYTPEFSLPNEIGLSNLNILGINFYQHDKSFILDFFKDENVQAQESFQRFLFLDLYSHNNTITTQLSNLFQICKNISVLAINFKMYISWPEGQEVFQGIRNLVRLRHIVVKLDDTRFPRKSTGTHQKQFSRTRDLFKHLHYCASSLESVTLHIDVAGGQSHFKDAILGFFKKSSNTLKSVTFIFISTRFLDFYSWKNTDIFYNLLSNLKQITSLKLAYEGFYSDSKFKSQSPNLEKLFLAQCLKELTILAPLVSSEHLKFSITNIESLTKLTIHCSTLSLDSSVYSTIMHFSTTLKHLELSLKSLSKDIWYKLLNGISFMSALETLKLKIGILDISKKEAMSDMKLKIKNHPSLKVAVFIQGENSEIDID